MDEALVRCGGRRLTSGDMGRSGSASIIGHSLRAGAFHGARMTALWLPIRVEPRRDGVEFVSMSGVPIAAAHGCEPQFRWRCADPGGTGSSPSCLTF